MTNDQIWEKAEALRVTHELLQASKIPLDLISFVELDLRFGVHPVAIETRFDREGIWPSPF